MKKKIISHDTQWIKYENKESRKQGHWGEGVAKRQTPMCMPFCKTFVGSS